MTTEIFYWDGLIIDEAIADKYVEVINQLKNGELQGAGLSLKKMRHHRVFSLSTSYSGRLLFTSRVINQKKCLIFLEELPNHDYKNSKFLNNPATLNQFLEKNHNDLVAIVDFEEEFMDIDEFPISLDINLTEKRLYTPVEYYDQEFIVLNSSQKHAKFAKGPAVIEGPPGSGKSCASLSLITNARAELNKILFLTSSPALVSHMEALYNSLPASLDSPPGRVVFKSYLQLVHESDPATESKKVVGQKHFAKWYAGYCNTKEHLLKNQNSKHNKSKQKRHKKQMHHLPQEVLDARNVYQEFRTTAAYSDYVDTQFGTEKNYTQLAYERLGEKHQSLFTKEHRPWLYQAFQDYAAYLKHTNHIDLSFYRLKSDEVFDMVVVDESQDFSKSQIQDITRLTSPALQIYFCRDSHQSLEDSQSSGPFIHEHLYRLGNRIGIKAQHIQLPCSYRVFPNAQSLVDRILDLRLKLIGGRADNLEYVKLPMTVEQNSTLGSVHWFDRVSEAVQTALQEATHSSDLIIITLPEFIEEARIFFKTDLIYTVDQVKGLQFPVVVLFRMAEDKALEEANKILSKPESSYVASSSTTNRPADGVGNPKFGPPLNRFFTAATRAQQQIIVIQPHQHKFGYVINAMKSAEQSADEFKIELNKQSYSEEKWLDLIRKLISKNEIALARKIYIQYLKKTPIEFKEFVKQAKTPCSASIQESGLMATSMLSTQGPVASSSSTSASSGSAASVSTMGLFSDRTTDEMHPSYREKRGSRNKPRIVKPLSLSVQASDTMTQQVKTIPATQSTRHSPQQNRRMRTDKRSSGRAHRDGFMKRISNEAYPGLYLANELSNGRLDSQNLISLFIYYPELCDLITIEHLCKVGEQPYSSLLSQLCCPFVEPRHIALNFLLERDDKLISFLVAGIKCYLFSFQDAQLKELTEKDQSLLNIFQKKVTDFRDIQYLNTTKTGKEILEKLAYLLNGSIIDLLYDVQNAIRKKPEPNFEISFQRQQIHTSENKHALFASQLNELKETFWQHIIAQYPLDDTSRKIVRLMNQGNNIGVELWNKTPFVNLADFFPHAFCDLNIQHLFSEQERELARRLITTLESHPHWTTVEELNYIDLELSAPDFDFTSIFSGILRTVRAQLILENRLLNKLYNVNMIFWNNIVTQFGEVFTNRLRIKNIMDQLAQNDSVAIKAWNSIDEIESKFKNNPPSCLLQFFTTCKNAMSAEEFEKCTLLQNIIARLEAEKPWELEACFNYITACLNSSELGRFSLLAGYLRFAQDVLGKQLLQEKTNNRQLMTHSVPVSIPEQSNVGSTPVVLEHEENGVEEQQSMSRMMPLN
ncbi:hypothetical protein ELY21_11215 [Legionella sp. km535]|uniref:hypothetical protein n=1 Tax=Legionella sp. km535 TaxID=2498107 RepID=UPI000F8DAFCF|nr:hypothetical protein [Legionella sp. km535]RUR17282.1 hypothetical protein ELY21_11215 [Legionella sp. km535]